MFRSLLLSSVSGLILIAAPAMAEEQAQATAWSAGYSANWLSQVGVTSSIETTANQGSGITIGLIDTGVAATNKEVSGRVSSASSCAAVSFRCSSGYSDDNGHGTATAAIAAGTTANGGWMSGVAPGATILEEKVLNASGTGTSTDVANGIQKAASANVNVISISISYNSTTDIVTAINAAAAKGIYVVWAAGNNSTSFDYGANTNGLSAAALSHLIIVGSVNSANKLSSFSNVAGAGYAVAGSTKASYSSLWLMSNGENIIAPGIMYGSTSYAYWSGTSMSAPQVAGALALLESTWPILKTNSSASTLLFKTATDLGSTGVDATYGNGLMNVTKAFQPYGALTVTAANGASIPVTSLSSSVLSGGALGPLSKISSALSSYTSFDSIQRNFTVNLSSLITSKTSTAAQVASAAVAPTASTKSVKLGEGATLSLTSTEASPQPGASKSPRGAWLAAMSDNEGRVTAMGQGFPATASFAEAMYGAGSKTAQGSRGLGIANGLSALADGGNFAAYGSPLGKDSRLAFSWSESQKPDTSMGGNNWQAPSANAFSAGLNGKLAEGWTGGATVGMLNETQGLLGSTYNGNGALSLGNHHQSLAFGLSSGFDLTTDTSLLAEGALARSDAASMANGLITGVTPTLSRSYGMALVQKNAFTDNDSLTLSAKKPMKVVSGSASLLTTGVDANGLAVSSQQKLGLAPSGSETDIGFAYSRPLAEGINMTAAASFANDAENTKGAKGGGAMVGLSLKF